MTNFCKIVNISALAVAGIIDGADGLKIKRKMWHETIEVTAKHNIGEDGKEVDDSEMINARLTKAKNKIREVAGSLEFDILQALIKEVKPGFFEEVENANGNVNDVEQVLDCLEDSDIAVDIAEYIEGEHETAIDKALMEKNDESEKEEGSSDQMSSTPAEKSYEDDAASGNNEAGEEWDSDRSEFGDEEMKAWAIAAILEREDGDDFDREARRQELEEMSPARVLKTAEDPVLRQHKK